MQNVEHALGCQVEENLWKWEIYGLWVWLETTSKAGPTHLLVPMEAKKPLAKSQSQKS